MHVVATVFTAALSSMVVALTFHAFTVSQERDIVNDWMPDGTLLLVARSETCPSGWNSRASVLAKLDYETSDDFSFQDFDYVSRTSNPQVIRLRTCVKTD